MFVAALIIVAAGDFTLFVLRAASSCMGASNVKEIVIMVNTGTNKSTKGDTLVKRFAVFVNHLFIEEVRWLVALAMFAVVKVEFFISCFGLMKQIE
jgi:hypothetical protein